MPASAPSSLLKAPAGAKLDCKAPLVALFGGERGRLLGPCGTPSCDITSMVPAMT